MVRLLQGLLLMLQTLLLRWYSMTFDNIREEIEMSLTVVKGNFFKRPEFGHRFRELRNAPASEKTRRKTEQFAIEALQWLIDYKHVRSVTATATYQRDDRLLLHVEAVLYVGETVTFERFVEVSDGH